MGGLSLVGSTAYKQTRASAYGQVLDGVAVFNSPEEVVDLSRTYFHLDDEQNYAPSLWHHG